MLYLEGGKKKRIYLDLETADLEKVRTELKSKYEASKVNLMYEEEEY